MAIYNFLDFRGCLLGESSTERPIKFVLDRNCIDCNAPGYPFNVNGVAGGGIENYLLNDTFNKFRFHTNIYTSGNNTSYFPIYTIYDIAGNTVFDLQYYSSGLLVKNKNNETVYDCALPINSWNPISVYATANEFSPLEITLSGNVIYRGSANFGSNNFVRGILNNRLAIRAGNIPCLHNPLLTDGELFTDYSIHHSLPSGIGRYGTSASTFGTDIIYKQFPNYGGMTIYDSARSYNIANSGITGTIRAIQFGISTIGNVDGSANAATKMLILNSGQLSTVNTSTGPVELLYGTKLSTKINEYNTRTNNNWTNEDIGRIEVGFSGTYPIYTKLATVQTLTVPAYISPSSYLNNVQFFCKTVETNTSGLINFYTYGTDCSTTLRPSGDAVVQHSSRWSSSPIWSLVNQDPDFIGDDSTFISFNSDDTSGNPTYLYYTGDGINRLHLGSGLYSQVLNKDTSINYNSRLYYNDTEETLWFGGKTTSTNRVDIENLVNELQTYTSVPYINFNNNIGYNCLGSYTSRTIVYTNGNSNTTLNLNLGLAPAETVVYHDIDQTNNQIYYLTSEGRLFRENVATNSVSGIGSLGIQVRGGTFDGSDQQPAAFDFDNKRIFFFPYNSLLGNLGIATTTFSGTIPAYSLLQTRSSSPVNNSYFDTYNSLIYDKVNDKIYFSKNNVEYLGSSGLNRAGIYSLPSSGGSPSTLIEANGGSGLAYGLALDYPRYRSQITFNLTDIPNNVLHDSPPQFSNVSVKMAAEGKISPVYIKPTITGSSGELMWRTTRPSPFYFSPSSGLQSQETGLYNSIINYLNNAPQQWQDALLRLDIHYPLSSGQFDLYATEVRAVCSGVFPDAPSITGSLPFYTQGVYTSSRSIDLYTIAGAATKSVDMFTGGKSTATSGFDMFIYYQMQSSGIDFTTFGKTTHSGAINFAISGPVVNSGYKVIDFYTYATSQSGLANVMDFYLQSSNSGKIGTYMNMSTSGYAKYNKSADINFVAYSPIPQNAKSIDFIAVNKSIIGYSSIKFYLHSSGTPGAKPTNSSIDFVIQRSIESAATHVPFVISGPKQSYSGVDFMTKGWTTGNSGVDMFIQANQQKINKSVIFYSHGF